MNEMDKDWVRAEITRIMHIQLDDLPTNRGDRCELGMAFTNAVEKVIADQYRHEPVTPDRDPADVLAEAIEEAGGTLPGEEGPQGEELYEGMMADLNRPAFGTVDGVVDATRSPDNTAIALTETAQIVARRIEQLVSENAALRRENQRLRMGELGR